MWCHRAGLPSGCVQIVHDQRKEGRLVVVGVVDLHGVAVIGRSECLLARFHNAIQYRWRANFHGQSISQTQKRDGPILRLAPPLCCLRDDSRRFVMQKDAAAGLVAVLSAGTTAALCPQIALGKQPVGSSGRRVGRAG